MKVTVNPGSLRETKPHEYAVRFLFGGLITAVTGIIAGHYGPAVAGLFLAFPAIFPASATLLAKHESQKHGGKSQERWGEKAASVDAAGAALGSIALLAFGGIVWKLAPSIPPWIVLALAMVSWLALSLILWMIRQKVR